MCLHVKRHANRQNNHQHTKLTCRKSRTLVHSFNRYFIRCRRLYCIDFLWCFSACGKLWIHKNLLFLFFFLFLLQHIAMVWLVSGLIGLQKLEHSEAIQLCSFITIWNFFNGFFKSPPNLVLQFDCVARKALWRLLRLFFFFYSIPFYFVLFHHWNLGVDCMGFVWCGKIRL